MAREYSPRPWASIALFAMVVTLGACVAPAGSDGARSTAARTSPATDASAVVQSTDAAGLAVTIVQMGDHWFIPAKRPSRSARRSSGG